MTLEDCEIDAFGVPLEQLHRIHDSGEKTCTRRNLRRNGLAGMDGEMSNRKTKDKPSERIEKQRVGERGGKSRGGGGHNFH
ncbi:Hypothetical predicted protein [Octopus vulgaris]|uniref:Uncharacterized protein n=1 Tax=Octopus vulgaris TaxID=6645 RepID=A0AA36BHG8_OCTVU|nr:Hypothetical predicted protein [Octopus vulgaris]